MGDDLVLDLLCHFIQFLSMLFKGYDMKKPEPD
jgi:hypothetical protein